MTATPSSWRTPRSTPSSPLQSTDRSAEPCISPSPVQKDRGDTGLVDRLRLACWSRRGRRGFPPAGSPRSSACRLRRCRAIWRSSSAPASCGRGGSSATCSTRRTWTAPAPWFGFSRRIAAVGGPRFAAFWSTLRRRLVMGTCAKRGKSNERRPLQRAVPVHPQFGAQRHRRVHSQPGGAGPAASREAMSIPMPSTC